MSLNVIEHFKKLCEIPHCSYEASEMRDYLCTFAKTYGYEVSVDAAGNVLAHKEGAQVTLQAHYDMVCIGTEFPLRLKEVDGWLQAENSTLGADNGMGMAMMLSLMQEGTLISCLFTAEEEVGLLGARGLALDLTTPYLLNLDSEDEGVVTIGCAGGVDIIATKMLQRQKRQLYVYEYHISGLSGGHSGVDIDKNIPNAISELFKTLCDVESYIVEVNGGERRNSIPKKADIVFGTLELLEMEGLVSRGHQEVEVMDNSCDIIKLLASFESGVRELNSELDMVNTSINLALIESSEEALRLQLSGRSMEKEALEALQTETIAYFEDAGFELRSEGFYAPWRPEKNTFSQLVLDESSKLFDGADYGAIHAGLECGIIKEKYPNILMASIGPTIRYPHSNREKVDLDSVAKVFVTLKNIIGKLNAV